MSQLASSRPLGFSAVSVASSRTWAPRFLAGLGRDHGGRATSIRLSELQGFHAATFQTLDLSLISVLGTLGDLADLRHAP